MQVDRAEFLRLATLLCGISSCGERAPAPVAPAAAGAGVEEARAGGAPLENRVAPPPGARAAADTGGRCDNRRGTLEACARVSPTCEGAIEECNGLTEDVVPRVAEQWAECFAAAGRKCRPKWVGKCLQAAVEQVCIEPGAVDTCKELMRACDEAGKSPRYTLEQCAKVVSAVKPDGRAQWKQVDEERMGPASPQEPCSLEYVLPYQPYGWMWR